LLSFPTNFSPTKRSPVFAVGLLIELKVNTGKIGALTLVDSKTPYTFITSGVFNEISLSWTLVPYTVLYVNPSFNVVVPIPDIEEADPTTVNTLIFCFSLIFSFTFILRNVAMSLAGLLVPNPLIVNPVEPEVKTNLSEDKDSVVPSVLIKT